MTSNIHAAIVSICLTAALLSGCQWGATDSVSSATGGTSVMISWQPPSTNIDGSELTNLAGYHIHYGMSSNALTSEIDVPIGLTDYVVTELEVNRTYYFAISSYNNLSMESVDSPIVSITTTS
jgi:hypothetical protein